MVEKEVWEEVCLEDSDTAADGGGEREGRGGGDLPLSACDFYI